MSSPTPENHHAESSQAKRRSTQGHSNRAWLFVQTRLTREGTAGHGLVARLENGDSIQKEWAIIDNQSALRQTDAQYLSIQYALEKARDALEDLKFPKDIHIITAGQSLAATITDVRLRGEPKKGGKKSTKRLINHIVGLMDSLRSDSGVNVQVEWMAKKWNTNEDMILADAIAKYAKEQAEEWEMGEFDPDGKREVIVPPRIHKEAQRNLGEAVQSQVDWEAGLEQEAKWQAEVEKAQNSTKLDK